MRAKFSVRSWHRRLRALLKPGSAQRRRLENSAATRSCSEARSSCSAPCPRPENNKEAVGAGRQASTDTCLRPGMALPFLALSAIGQFGPASPTPSESDRCQERAASDRSRSCDVNESSAAFVPRCGGCGGELCDCGSTHGLLGSQAAVGRNYELHVGKFWRLADFRHAAISGRKLQFRMFCCLKAGCTPSRLHRLASVRRRLRHS